MRQTKRTALHMAAIKNHPQVAKRLLVAGADASGADSNLMTPLHLAAQHGHDSVIEELLNAGANIDVLDKNNYSALHSGSRQPAHFNRHEAAGGRHFSAKSPRRNWNRQVPQPLQHCGCHRRERCQNLQCEICKDNSIELVIICLAH